MLISLVLMTVLSLLGLTAMRSATLELAMAGNAQDYEQALQLAESGISAALSPEKGVSATPGTNSV